MAIMRYIHKISLNDRSDVFLLSNYESNKKLSVTLIDIDQCEAFAGSATDVELRSLAASLRMNFSVFVSLTTKALSQKESEDLTFLYSFEENCQNFVFKWKSIDSDETTITLGILKMFKKDYTSMIKDVFTLLAEEFLILNKKVVDLESGLSIVKKEKEDALNLLSEAANVKESIEKELFAKFVLILNGKKRKIRDLEQNSNPEVSKNSRPSKYKPAKMPRSKLHEISDSSDEVDDNLENINAPGPSNLKWDNSLLFDDEPEVSISRSKMRNRNVTKASVKEDAASTVDIRSTKDSDTESEDDLLKFL